MGCRNLEIGKALNVIGTPRLLKLGDWKLRLDFHDGGGCTYRDSDAQVRECERYECMGSKNAYLIFKVGHSFIGKSRWGWVGAPRDPRKQPQDCSTAFVHWWIRNTWPQIGGGRSFLSCRGLARTSHLTPMSASQSGIRVGPQSFIAWCLTWAYISPKCWVGFNVRILTWAPVSMSKIVTPTQFRGDNLRCRVYFVYLSSIATLGTIEYSMLKPTFFWGCVFPSLMRDHVISRIS